MRLVWRDGSRLLLADSRLSCSQLRHTVNVRSPPDSSQSPGGHSWRAAKLNVLADGDGFEGICYPVKIREFDQHKIIAELINDGAHLTFGKVTRRNVFPRRNDIK